MLEFGQSTDKTIRSHGCAVLKVLTFLINDPPCALQICSPSPAALITPDLNMTDQEGALLTVGYTVSTKTPVPPETAHDGCMRRCI